MSRRFEGGECGKPLGQQVEIDTDYYEAYSSLLSSKERQEGGH